MTALSPAAEGTLLIATLDGKLVALNKATGEIRWEVNDQPAVRSPFDADKPRL